MYKDRIKNVFKNKLDDKEYIKIIGGKVKINIEEK